ncbi:MAG: DASS family sodium-coupled anion symporter [Fimbriimonadaceae bacterium]|nr:DASS family sodium-coupled anion symporter [Fimbriimonadaceae bacterium]
MRWRLRQAHWVWLAPLLALLFALTVDLDPEHPAATRMAAVTIWMALWWVTEAVPLAVTALLPLAAFPLLGVMSAKDVAPAYLDQITFLFIGGYLLAMAMQRWGLHERFALQTVLLCGSSPRRLLLGFLLGTGFLSFWTANTAATMVMLPPVLAVIKRLTAEHGEEQVRPLELALLLAIAYAASIGGVATLVGTPTNLVFVRLFGTNFPDAPDLSFFGWMKLAAPLAVLMLLAAWGVLSFLYLRRCTIGALDRREFSEQYRALGPATYEQKLILVIAELLVFAWIFRADIDLGPFKVLGWSSLPFLDSKLIADSTVAMLAGLLLLLLPSRSEPGRPLLTWAEAERLPWGIVLLFGGGFALAAGFTKSGLAAWCGQELQTLQGVSPLTMTLVVCLSLVFLTEFTANTSTVEMVLPVLAAAAVALRVNPLFLMVPATICASFGFMMPAGTPPNAIVFATGRLPVWQMVKTGVLLNVLGALLAAVAVLTWGRHALGVDLLAWPAWAVR